MTRLGEYELIRKIGSGGMAQVWGARKPLLGGRYQRVALKRLPAHLIEDPAYRRMFVREAGIAAALKNSRIVTVYAAREIEGEAVIEMEWIDGPNLAQLMRWIESRGEVMSTRVALHIIAEILRALDYAHTVVVEPGRVGVMHRDISPSNILLTDSGDVKVADFGIARVVSDQTTGTVKGKLHYIAPEQFEGRASTASDLYSTGIIFHELMAGQRFRSGQDELHLQGQVRSGHIPPLPTGTLPEGLERLRRALLEPDPARRVPSAQAALELLRGSGLYADASFELRKLVMAYEGIDAPRSGVHAAADSKAKAADVPGTSTATALERVRPPASLPSGEGVGIDAAGFERPAPMTTGDRPPAAWGLRLALAGLVSVAGVAGTLWARSGAGGPEGAAVDAAGSGGTGSTRGLVAASPHEAATTTTAEVASYDDAARSQDARRGEDRPAVSSTTRAPGLGAGRESDTPRPHETQGERDPSERVAVSSGAAKGEGSLAPAQAPASSTTPRNVAPVAPRVEVLLHAGDYPWGRLRVDGRVYLLEPSKRVRLRVGSHRVAFSDSLDGPFTSLGRVELEGAKHQRLRVVGDPPRVSLSRID